MTAIGTKHVPDMFQGYCFSKDVNNAIQVFSEEEKNISVYLPLIAGIEVHKLR